MYTKYGERDRSKLIQETNKEEKKEHSLNLVNIPSERLGL